MTSSATYDLDQFFAAIQDRDDQVTAGIRRTPPLDEDTPIPPRRRPRIVSRRSVVPALALTPYLQKISTLAYDSTTSTIDGQWVPLKESDSVDKIIDESEDCRDGGMCPICHDNFGHGALALRLPRCKPGHCFHEDCIREAFKNYPWCPSCKIIYLEKKRPQPKGSMSIMHIKKQLPGEIGPGCFVIRYSFPDGVQGVEHPNPGVEYSGTNRKAYISDSSKGQLVMAKLMRAFDLGLVFMVGYSVTNDVDDTVVWAGIHHKTSPVGGVEEFGYPDHSYLDRVDHELTMRGIVSPPRPGLSYQLTSVDSADYIIYDTLLRNSWKTKSKYTFQCITRVMRVHNSVLEERYLRYKDSLPGDGNEKLLFHGTANHCDGAGCIQSPCGLCGILSKGFLPEYIAPGFVFGVQRFGPGYYFAVNSSKSHEYPANTLDNSREHNHERQLLLCKVATGRAYETIKNRPYSRGPPEGYDSIHGQSSSGLTGWALQRTGLGPEDDEIVTFLPESILPWAIVYYYYQVV